MYTKDYVEATYKVLAENEDTKHVLGSLSVYLKKRGLLKLYPAILRGLEAKVIHKEKSLVPRIIVAREKDVERHKTEIQAYMSEERTPHITIDPTIIGGFIIKTKGTYIDHSHKSKLLQAYHRITN